MIVNMLKKGLLCAILLSVGLGGSEKEPSIRFAWLSDTHIGTDNADVDLRDAVTDINSFGNIDFVIVSGDITEVDIGDNLDLAKAILDSSGTPYYIVPGNHETRWSSSGSTKFLKLWGNDKFVFENSNFLFIGLHQGPMMRMGDGYFAKEDLRWLESVLKDMGDHDKKLCFVTHYPIDESVSNWFEFLNIIQRFNPQVILHGHGHRNRSTDYSGIPGVMGRSTLRGGDAVGGYNIVEIYADSMFFFERKTGQQTLPAWHRLALRSRTSHDSLKYVLRDSSPNEAASNVRVKWSYQSSFTIASGPAVSDDDNIVVITNKGGEVQAISLEDGSLLWTTAAGGPIYSTPEIAYGNIYFGATDSMIYCLRLHSGELAWSYKTKAPVVASPVVYKNTVLIGGSDTLFRCFNAKTGTMIWERRGITGFVETKPLVVKRRVIFGAWDESLYALHPGNGRLLWRWHEGRPGLLYSPAACTPVGNMSRVFIVAPDRAMTGIETKTGETVWRTTRFMVRESIGISEDGRTVFAKTMQDTVVAIEIDTQEPTVKWVSHVGYGYDIAPSLPVEKGGTVFFGTKDGYIYALESNTGEVKWHYRISFGLVNNVVPISGNQVIATAADGKVSLLEYPN